MAVAPEQRCWVCGATGLEIAKPGDLERPLDSDAFAITDSHYGRTAEIHRCRACGFLQCSGLGSALAYYEELEDREYEEGRAQRTLQMERLLRRLPPAKAGARLLDVGAGSGMLVEQALAKGYRAEGVEPSRWLQARAVERGLAVELGTLPNPRLVGPYDVVTCIDVIEHVSDPAEVLRCIREVLAPHGILAIVTPDVRSWAARLMGWRWWHFRVAHIGYFDPGTLQRLLDACGFELVELHRPGWYFSADYLLERVGRYLPDWIRLPSPSWLSSITVPLNLRDSLLALARLEREA